MYRQGARRNPIWPPALRDLTARGRGGGGRLPRLPEARMSHEAHRELLQSIGRGEIRS
jgi:hypothetical protein